MERPAAKGLLAVLAIATVCVILYAIVTMAAMFAGVNTAGEDTEQHTSMVVTVTDLERGETLSRGMFEVQILSVGEDVEPVTDQGRLISADEVEAYLGLPLARSIPAGKPLRTGDFAGSDRAIRGFSDPLRVGYAVHPITN
jgi:Flp pilus assembly protein CpaB